MIAGLSTRIIAMIVGAVLLLGIIAFGVHSCDQRRSKAAQSRVNDAQSGAFQNSAGDAVATQGAVNQRTSDSEATTRSNERDIRNAQGADDAVNSGVRDAGFTSLCKRPSFRNSPTGRLRCPPAS
jgi:FtsZ-interacting cell division protein ZipA